MLVRSIEQTICEDVLADCKVSQAQPKPFMGIIKRKVRPHQQWFAVVEASSELPYEFEDFPDIKRSAINLPATDESVLQLKSCFRILEGLGHHFENLQIRFCINGDAIVYCVDIRGDEPRLFV